MSTSRPAPALGVPQSFAPLAVFAVRPMTFAIAAHSIGGKDALRLGGHARQAPAQHVGSEETRPMPEWARTHSWELLLGAILLATVVYNATN